MLLLLLFSRSVSGNRSIPSMSEAVLQELSVRFLDSGAKSGDSIYTSHSAWCPAILYNLCIKNRKKDQQQIIWPKTSIIYKQGRIFLQWWFFYPATSGDTAPNPHCSHNSHNCSNDQYSSNDRNSSNVWNSRSTYSSNNVRDSRSAHTVCNSRSAYTSYNIH